MYNPTDKKIICKDCNKPFYFTEGEQEFYKTQGFSAEPKRCKTCRRNRKAGISSNNKGF